MSSIIIDINKPDPSEQATYLDLSIPKNALQRFSGASRFYAGSGDEVSYEYVHEERSYYVDTTSQKAMLVLPPNPRENFNIVVADYCGSWSFYPLVIHRNGKPIMGFEENMVCDVPGAIFSLTYTSTRIGWVVGSKLLQPVATTFFKESR